jgi:hypothetical protein
LKWNEFVCIDCDAAFCSKQRADMKRCRPCSLIHKTRYSQTWQRLEVNQAAKARRYSELRRRVIDGYGGLCQCCGEKAIEFLAIDHVDGGGREERLRLSIHQIMVKIERENFPDDYRILCHNCNQAIGWYGYCPHQRL